METCLGNLLGGKVFNEDDGLDGKPHDTLAEFIQANGAKGQYLVNKVFADRPDDMLSKSGILQFVQKPKKQ